MLEAAGSRKPEVMLRQTRLGNAEIELKYSGLPGRGEAALRVSRAGIFVFRRTPYGPYTEHRSQAEARRGPSTVPRSGARSWSFSQRSIKTSLSRCSRAETASSGKHRVSRETSAYVQTRTLFYSFTLILLVGEPTDSLHKSM